MLRQATATDFTFIYGLYMHPQTNPWLLYEPMDEAAFAPVYEDLFAKACIYVFEQGGRALGMCKLLPQPHRNSHTVYLGGVAIDPAEAGKGHGKRMLLEAIDWAREKGFWRIELTVAAINTKAIALYQKAGFAVEGTLRQFTWLKSEGRLIDEVMMSYLFKPTDMKKKVLFVCIENSNRSQMSQAFANIYGGNGVEAYSAGSRPSGVVNPKAIAAMAELGYDLGQHDSKDLEAVKAHAPFDAVVTMGCGDACPWMPAKRFVDWQIPDPKHMEPAAFNEVRDFIGAKVKELLASL
jgi:arsenate reductase (thioredoxin)